MLDQDHGHGHEQLHAAGGGANRDANRRRLTLVLCLAASYTVVEIVGGVLTSSLALLADAFHLLSDVAALALSLFAVWMAQRPATARRTYGHSRAEILAALANGVGLALMALLVAMNAIERFGQPAEVDGLGVVFFASGALVYEGVSLWLLHAGASHNLNVRGAFLHILSDALGSVGAILAGAAIWARGWLWADPLASLLISALVLRSAWGLIRDAVDILMETAPAHLDVGEIHDAMAALPHVVSVHDLHVWTIGSGEIALSCHLVGAAGSESGKLVHEVRDLLRSGYEISHSTVQVEAPGEQDESVSPLDCEGACDG